MARVRALGHFKEVQSRYIKPQSSETLSMELKIQSFILKIWPEARNGDKDVGSQHSA